LLTHTHTFSIDPAIVGSTGGRVFLEFSGVRSSHSTSSIVAKRVPLRPIFRVGNSQKSLGARSFVVQQFLAEKSTPVVTQPPYSPDFAPSDFWLFLENGPQGDAFRNHERYRMECNGRTPEDSKISLPPVVPTMARSMEQVCVCV